MMNMTVSGRRNAVERGYTWLYRMAALLPATFFVCLGCLGWLAVGNVYAAEVGYGSSATPLPPQPTAGPPSNAQIVSDPAPQEDEALVWPWKQENPEPKARLGRVSSNAVAATDDEFSSHTISTANNVTAIGQMGGASFRVAINGNYAYIGSGYNMTILNIANPAAVYVTGKTTSAWANEVLGISVQDGYAYIAAGNEGLRIVDISDETQPVEVGFYKTPGYAWDVAVAGSIAYVADGENGLQIVDVSIAYAPQLKSNLALPGNAMDVAIAGIYAYVADENEGLRIVDITDPAFPIETGHLKTQGRAVGLAVAGNYVFLAADKSGMRIIDVGSKSSPYELVAFETRGNAYAVDLDAAANIAFVADAGEGLRAVDVSKRSTPREIGHFDVAGCWANDIRVKGSYAYLIDTSHGLRVLNVTNPAELSQVFLYNSPATTDVKVVGNTAFVPAGSAGLRVIDISTPASPVESGYFDTPGYAYAVDLAFPPGSSSKYACVADWEKGVRIVDVTDPRAPFEVGAVDTPGMARDVAVLWPYAYVADDSLGLQIVALNDMSNPVIVGVCDQVTCMPPGGSARGVTMLVPSDTSQKIAFIADGDKGLYLIDVTDPLNPGQIGFYDTPGQAQNVAISPTLSLAYVADGFNGGLQIVDFSSPTNLIPLGAVDTGGSANDLGALRGQGTSGDVLFLADGADGLRIFNVKPVTGSRPTITEKGFYDTRDWAGRLTVVGKNTYVADGQDGLRVLEVSGSLIPAAVNSKESVAQEISPAAIDDVSNQGGTTQPNSTDKPALNDLNANESVAEMPSDSSTNLIQPAQQNVGLVSSRQDGQKSDEGFALPPPTPVVINPNKPSVASDVPAAIFPLGGVVRDESGKPVAGVIVDDSAEHRVATDEKGIYLMALPGGAYTLTPAKDGLVFDPQNRRIIVGKESQRQDFTAKVIERKINNEGVIEGEYSYTGVIRFQGQPLAGVVISDGSGKSVISDANGVFRWIGPAGSYVLTPVKEGFTFVPEVLRITLPVLLDAVFEFEAKEGAFSVSGVVLTTDGSPLAGVSLADQIGQSMSDRAGEFTFTRERGTYTFHAAKDGYRIAPEMFEVTLPEVDGAKNLSLLATPLCPNYILNGDFEREGDWTPQSGAALEFSQEVTFRGLRAAIIGPTQQSKPLNGHMNVRQKVTIPKNSKVADLRFMLYLFSEGEVDGTRDAQQVLILDKNQKDKERVLNLHAGDRIWRPYRLDLHKYAGQTIWVAFDVSNDGKGGSLGMAIDDVTLQVCE